MRRIRAQERETKDIIGEGGGGARKRKKPQTSYRNNVENGGDLGGRRNNVDRQESVGSSRYRPRISRE